MTTKITLSAKIVAWLTFLLGIGLGIYTLSSSIGVWLGLWDFRRGFDILRGANNIAGSIALVCLLATAIVLLLSLLYSRHKAVALTSIAFAGTIAAALSYYVPETFRPPEGVNYPPIHDISTDTVNPLEFVDILPLRVDAANTTVYGGSPDMTPEQLARLQTEAFPDLIPRRFDEAQDQVFSRALAAVEEMGWDLVAQVPEDGRIEATATTFWFRFKDDVVIKLHSEGNQTVVNARSLSRVGVGDLGANANRLRAFFELL